MDTNSFNNKKLFFRKSRYLLNIKRELRKIEENLFWMYFISGDWPARWISWITLIINIKIYDDLKGHRGIVGKWHKTFTSFKEFMDRSCRYYR